MCGCTPAVCNNNECDIFKVCKYIYDLNGYNVESQVTEA